MSKLNLEHEFGHRFIVFSNHAIKPPPLVRGGRYERVFTMLNLGRL